MAIYKDVTVNIQRLTAALAEPNQGLCLILTTESNQAYAEYSDLSSVATVYPTSTEAYKAANAIFGQNPRVDKVAIVGISADPDINAVVEGLSTMFAKHNDWKFLVSNVFSDTDMTAIQTWATGNQRYYFGVIATTAVDTVTNPASDYVAYMVHDIKESYPEAAWIGRCSTFLPGSATWKFKTLSGIQPVEYDDQAADVENIHDHHYNTYVSKHGLNMTSEGFLTSGEYIDVMLGVDWIQSDMELRIQRVLMTTPKVPYDTSGISLIASQVEDTLKEATNRGIIRRDEAGNGEYQVNIPRLADIPTNDIANRVLRSITFTAYLAGAIHEVIVNGTVQY